jgi:dipeptidyl aminopeptidase/acylaminoacyl peptidase
MIGRIATIGWALLMVNSMTLPAAETHPFSVHDMVAMDRISDPQVSPDGRRIVFVVRTTDLDANKGRNDLWLVNVDGTGLRRLTTHPAGDTEPRWSPDGKTIWFISSRSDSSQVWKISPDGGEAEQVTREPLDVSALVISPDGTRIAFAMEVFPGTDPAETKKRLDEQAAKKATGRIYERLFIRHWDTWKDGRRSHVFVMSVTGGPAIDVMKDMDADSPSKPFGGAEEITFTPDGKSVVFTARDAGREEAWSTDLNLFLAPADGSARPRPLTAANRATDTHPVFSPDGKTLAYLAMQRAGYEADRYRIMLKPWPNGEPVNLTENWDFSPSFLSWSSDGKFLYTAADNTGQHSLFSVDVTTGSIKTLAYEGSITWAEQAGDRIAFAMHHLMSPVELYAIRPDNSEVTPITKINAEKLARTRLGDAEQFAFVGAEGDKVFCYVVKPVDFDPSKKYPVAFLIHGGPQGSFGNDFHYRWNPQAYAGAGYAAVMVDFHGSTGYGQAFTDSIRGDWGGKPFTDLKLGLEATLKKYPWMDGDRVAALGASYGGYMINWIAGQWPDRFRCLVNHDGTLDEKFGYFDTEELWFPEWEQRGTPWGNPEQYEKHNPIHHVKNWKTPMLVIHGAKDFRVVETQGIATFTALQRKGIPSKLLYFPDENHWVLKPHNSILWHETVIGWLDQWTKK